VDCYFLFREIRFDFRLYLLCFIDATLTPFTSPSVLALATLAFLAVFRVLIRDFFSIDISAISRLSILIFSGPRTRRLYALAMPNPPAAPRGRGLTEKSGTYGQQRMTASARAVKI